MKVVKAELTAAPAHVREPDLPGVEEREGGSQLSGLEPRTVDEKAADNH